MEKEIIEKYKRNYSIESLCKEFKIGKLKLKKILIDNGVTIKPKGGQNKYESVNKIIYSNVKIKCKCCGKEFNDIDNKSGGIVSHIKKCFPEISIPSSFKRRMYLKNTGNHWHLTYFDIVEKKNSETIECSECGWVTTDLTNKTGSLTKHIESKHSSIDDYLLKYPTQLNLFPTHNKTCQKNEFFKDENNFVTCKICDEQFKTISNTHLSIHNTNSHEYKLMFGEDSLLSNTTKNQFISNLSDCVINHTYRSKSEIEIEEFLKSLGIQVNICDKKQLSGIELDIFLPEYNIAIEYNGLYWHSEKQGKHQKYHLNKTIKCLEKNIQLIHIFSDEWLTKKNIIKNRLINLLNKNDKKIYARNCEIIELTKQQKSDYLKLNHLQGNDKSSIYFGLLYKGEIISVMTFGKLRNVLGNKTNQNDEYELYRYCSNNVIGGFTKLLKYFIKKYSPKKIITYANKNWSPSDNHCFYSKVGFNYVGETKPNYSYTKKYDIREHRFNYRKDRLVKMGYDKNKTENQIMNELGYDKIWDTGNLKYVLSI